MLNVFMAGPDRVSWELTALGTHGEGPYRLAIHHPTGMIVEYFDQVSDALLREGELEALLIAARSVAIAELNRSLIDPNVHMKVH